MRLSFGQILFKRATDYLKIALSISGFVPKHATWWRIILMSVACVATVFFSEHYFGNAPFAIAYFFVTTAIYLGFIYSVLPQDGYRLWFIEKYGEKKGYLVYEAILGIIFFMQGAGLGYVSSALPANFSLSAGTETFIKTVAVTFLIVGFGIKIWATKVVSVNIYYWKDMFLGRRIGDFVVEGPYKLVKNPMYGLGHLQAYATALWFFSWWGLVFAAINQLLIFTFYFTEEKKFINRIYLKKQPQLKTESIMG